MESVCEESTAAPDRNQKGGGGEHLIKDLKRKANSLSRDTRQANALGLEGRPPPHENCSAPWGRIGTRRELRPTFRRMCHFDLESRPELRN